MPGVIQQFRWARLLSKAFDLKGAAPPLQVLDDVMPVASLYDPTDVEHHFGRDEYLWSVGFTVSAGGAGNRGVLQYQPRSGYISVVEGLWITGVAAGRNYSSRIQAGTPGSVMGSANLWPIALDQRFENATSPGSDFYQGVTAAAAPTAYAAFYTTSANISNPFPVGVVLDQDDVWELHAHTANESFSGTVFGYDRRAEISERG